MWLGASGSGGGLTWTAGAPGVDSADSFQWFQTSVILQRQEEKW